MKYFSLFTGVGGFELGIEKVDESAECVGFSEIDKYASQVLKYKFPNVKNYGDITKINWFEVPDFDLLVGGSPCQDFSIAGKRAGISGERSGLVWEFIRCLEEKKPQYFIWENVKGVMSSRKGLDFGSILTAFSESGYSLWWQVLNAKDFGVPQNRERIFVVGFRDRCPREVFFERGDGAEITSPPPVRKQSSNTIRTNYSNGRSNETYVLKEITQNQSQGYRVYDPKGIATNQASQAGGVGAKTGLYAVSPTIRAEHHNTADVHFISESSRIRRLTPTECERLMSWPDGHTKYGINEKGEKVEISDTQRYRQCGNGVVSEVVAAIVKELLLTN